MGLLKKLTKPVSKFLDKIVPNEVKPFLPYLAAFAPFMMPPGMAFASKGIFSNPMFTRALMSGGANLASQLAQEGSEGEFSPLSVALASGVGALGAENAPEFFQGMQRGPTGVDKFGAIEVPYSDTGIMASISDAIGKGGVGAAEFIGEAGDVLRPGGIEPGLDTATLKALSVPVSQGTADLAMADARRALQDYEDEMAGTDDPLYSDEGRRRAIRAAMEAAGHLEDTILDALASLGLKEGGIVGLKHGGQLVKRGPGRPGYKGLPIDLSGINPGIIQEWLDMGGADGDYATPQEYYEDFYGDIDMAQGGIANALPKGREVDYRGGGVIPIGSRERADDVPARLSKNEFVMTADAVRAAGGGNINQGAKRMYNLMNNLEARV